MSEPPDKQDSSSESPTTTGLLVGLAFVGVILLVGGGRLMHRQLWMDEIHTWLIVTDPSPSHSMAALENGACLLYTSDAADE